MSYFTILSLGYGLVMLLTRPMIHLFPQAWADIEMGKIYTDRQPVWVWLVGCFGVGLVAFTWYTHFTAEVPYSIIVTLVISLTLVKLSQVLFNYKQFRAFAERVLRRERQTMNRISMVTVFLGLGLLALGIFVY